MSDADTIVAAATAPGRGGIGVVRISGPAAQSIAIGVLGSLPAARRAVFAAFRDAEQQSLDAGLVLFSLDLTPTPARTSSSSRVMAARSLLNP